MHLSFSEKQAIIQFYEIQCYLPQSQSDSRINLV